VDGWMMLTGTFKGHEDEFGRTMLIAGDPKNVLERIQK